MGNARILSYFPIKAKKLLLILSGLLIIAAIITAFLTINLVKPFNSKNVLVQRTVVTDYEQAVSRIDQLDKQQNDVNPYCRTILKSHAKKTQRVVVLFHGLTGCPYQMTKFADLLHAQGYTVLVPRLPRHGHKDSLTNEQQMLTAEELARFADDVIDIAPGLGEKVTVMGFSFGGTTATWVAQNRNEINHTIVIAPLLGYYGNKILTKPITNLFFIAPNWYRYWEVDPLVPPGTPYGYPRYSTKAVAEIVRLGDGVIKQSKTEPPKAGRITVVTNILDKAINNEMVYELAANWTRLKPNAISRYEFAADLQLDHDVFDVDKPEKYEKSYPILLNLIGQ